MTPRTLRILIALSIAGAALVAFGLWLWNHPLLDPQALGQAQRQSSQDGSNDTDRPSTGGSPPARPIELHAARGFTATRLGPCTLVTVLNPRQGDARTFKYLLVPRGTARADIPQVDADLVISTPVRRIVALSVTHLPPLDELGALDRLVGVGQAKLIYHPEVRARLDSGDVTQVATGGRPDVERLLALGPDAIMTSIINETDNGMQAMRNAGLPVIVNADYMEPTPLGRAEWIEFMALFLGPAERARANRLYADIARNYRTLAERARRAAPKPVVLLNTEFKGTWYMAGGESYMARLLADAGARYPWADTDVTGTLPLDFEAVFARASDADVWLTMGQADSRAALLRQNPLYAKFRAFRDGRLYNNDARTTRGGGNDYWERALSHPDKLLADLVRILHPGLAPDHEPVWFRKME